MGNEAWLIGREMDALKYILVTRILVFDFESFIGERWQLVNGCNNIFSFYKE